MKKGLNISTFSNIQKAVSIEEEPKKEEKKTMMSYILERGFLSKSEQEDLRDLIQEIKEKGGIISKEGILTCYYALSKYNKKSYEKTGEVGAGSDKIVVSIKNDNSLKKFGDEILTLYIPIERLYFLASTKDSILLKIPFRSSYRRINLKQFSKK
jgi:hypothetical protein